MWELQLPYMWLSLKIFVVYLTKQIWNSMFFQLSTFDLSSGNSFYMRFVVDILIQEVLLSFDTTRTASKTTRPTILRCRGNVFTEPFAYQRQRGGYIYRHTDRSLLAPLFWLSGVRRGHRNIDTQITKWSHKSPFIFQNKGRRLKIFNGQYILFDTSISNQITANKLTFWTQWRVSRDVGREDVNYELKYLTE
jgi:hypothetical protein